MTDTKPNPLPELPSSGSLIRATILAAVVAAVLLVTVVLPAEYGIDPTGIGKLIGLTRMGEIKVSLEGEAARDAEIEVGSIPATPETPTIDSSKSDRASRGVTEAVTGVPENSHITEIILAPNEGKEIKLVMRKDAEVNFSWSTDRGMVNYDTHADSPGIKYHGYEKGVGKNSQEGVLVAAFDGAHGWFWRNRGDESVTVTLRTDGEYQEIKHM